MASDVLTGSCYSAAPMNTISELTDEQKRLKIAEACGKHQYLGCLSHGSRCTNCGELIGEPQHYIRPPDYLNDLNAMHEAWKTLSEEKKHRFQAHLQRIVVDEFQSDSWLICAEARQRAEAFLRAIK
jgi:hypothetical protein